MAPNAKSHGTRFGGKSMAVLKAAMKKKDPLTDFPLYPWKMLRPRYGIFISQCNECRDYTYNNPNSAVVNDVGGVDVSLRSCKKCAKGNIYLSNVYKKFFGKPVDGEEEEDASDE
ncbi:hypothetical protein AAVH_18229 [Aphelenchoides avenae]|nr:hypothetical protein AAVH_37868 [Aphelenchus avenae]KAH7714410.1 hypothetical protein AAVH_18229 [Aphelenchus avenae]